jgi:hypothetical protein
MNIKAVLEVLLAFLAFVPLGVSVLYARAHGRTTPPLEFNVALFAAFAVIAVILIVAEQRDILRT